MQPGVQGIGQPATPSDTVTRTVAPRWEAAPGRGSWASTALRGRRPRTIAAWTVKPARRSAASARAIGRPTTRGTVAGFAPPPPGPDDPVVPHPARMPTATRSRAAAPRRPAAFAGGPAG